MRMSKKHTGVQLIGVANKNAVFAMLVGPTKRFETQWSKFFEDFDGFVMIRPGKLNFQFIVTARMDFQIFSIKIFQISDCIQQL